MVEGKAVGGGQGGVSGTLGEDGRKEGREVVVETLLCGLVVAVTGDHSGFRSAFGPAGE